jgi:hypothetical protein
MSRTVSARIPEDLHEELRERCNKVGCSINDYVKEAIGFVMTGNSKFDFGDDEDDQENSVDKINEVLLDAEKFKPRYDKYDNYWTFDEKNNKLICHLNLENILIKP